MRHHPHIAVTALATAAMLTLSACSSDPTSDSDTGGEGKTLTVWVMDGDYTDATLNALNSQFTQATGAKVDLQIQ